jgi:hypothetical protein
VIALATGGDVRAQKAKPDAGVKKVFDMMLGAIKDNDRAAFIAHGTAAVKEGTTQEIMDQFQKLLGGRLKKEYQADYLCQLKQAGHQVHLWKLAFKDGGDDVVIRIAFKDAKVGGFFLQ